MLNNNTRLAGMLRNLAQFYHKEPSDLFMVRLAQICGCHGNDVIRQFSSPYMLPLVIQFLRMRVGS